MSRGFRPGLLPSLLVAVLLPLLVGLGFWQLSRAEEKRLLLASYEARRTAAPISVGELERSPDPAYRRVLLQGYFDTRHSLLLDNRTHAGQPGVELLQPFYDQSSGLWLLVNRGWLPWPDRRVPPTFDTPQGVQLLHAWAYVPPGAAFRLRDDPPDDGWPRLVTRVDVTGLWQQLGRGGLALELRLEPCEVAYHTDWPVVAMGPEKHIGYAVQWFALAAALLGLFIYLGVHNARGNAHGDRHDSRY
ncbi:SURF1 family protein [Zestomonas thermotolerans]|jgi:surfeit locus 1 family protein|uniref:SURF1 family protein n=1 Tax=Zestomonas thermotolerans TaxID=157784 RepID=UPI0003814D12|nr:SURF1 family protein [Pseudomonas thermotolerans]